MWQFLHGNPRALKVLIANLQILNRFSLTSADNRLLFRKESNNVKLREYCSAGGHTLPP